MNLLLVGGTGVLSSAIAETALAKGDAVTVINRGNRNAIPGCEAIVSDRHDYDKIENGLGNRHFDVAIDFLVFNREDSIRSFEFYSKRCNQYVLVSSCFVYDFSKGGFVHEGSPRGLSCWKYSSGKCEAEDALVHAAARSGCGYTIVRPFVTYGNTRIPYSLAPAHGFDWTMVFRALAGKPLLAWNGGRGRCNITRVEDFCTGLFGLLLNKRAYGESVNVCGDEAPRWIDVVAALEETSGTTIPLLDLPKEFIQEHYPERKEEIDGRSFDVFASNEKLKSLVPSFRSTIPLRDGIAKTVSAYRANNFQQGVDWGYDAKCDEVVNAWHAMNRIGKKYGFVNYPRRRAMNHYLRYINASSNSDLGFRLFRKCLNAGMRFAGGLR